MDVKEMGWQQGTEVYAMNTLTTALDHKDFLILGRQN